MIKAYAKSFVNPIIALAFKEGIDFVGDPDYKASPPRKEGENWIVIIHHDDDEDDDDNINDEEDMILLREMAARAQSTKAPATFSSYEERLKNIKPLEVKVRPSTYHKDAF